MEQPPLAGSAAEPGPLLWQSLWLALLCAALSLLLAVLCLEALPARRATRTLWLVCLPLLLPQASLLFGLRLQTDGLGFTGIGPGWVLWSQLIFVFPYVYLCLHGPYRQFDERLTRVALTLGASPWGPGGESRVPCSPVPCCSPSVSGRR
jgi:putative thiamine transport system permease protein